MKVCVIEVGGGFDYDGFLMFVVLVCDFECFDLICMVVVLLVCILLLLLGEVEWFDDMFVVFVVWFEIVDGVICVFGWLYWIEDWFL